MNDYYTDDNESGWYEPDPYRAEEDRPFYDDAEKDWKGSHNEDVDEWDEWEEIEDDDEDDDEEGDDDEWE